MSLDHRTLVHLAHLARLELDAAEADDLLKDMSRILAYFSVLDECDPGTDLPAPEERGRLELLRTDRAEVTVSHTEALSSAPEADGGEFTVPAVVRHGAGDSGER